MAFLGPTTKTHEGLFDVSDSESVLRHVVEVIHPSRFSIQRRRSAGVSGSREADSFGSDGLQARTSSTRVRRVESAAMSGRSADVERMGDAPRGGRRPCGVTGSLARFDASSNAARRPRAEAHQTRCRARARSAVTALGRRLRSPTGTPAQNQAAHWSFPNKEAERPPNRPHN